MDERDRRRRPNDPNMAAATAQSRYPVQDPNAQGRRSYSSVGTSDRYRPAPINTSPSASRNMSGTASYSGYYQDPAPAFSTAIQPNTMAYQSEYGSDSRQAQSFGPYATSMMYNVPQPGAQGSVYDTNQQFQSRQPAALQMMPTDVGAPYFPNEPTSTAAASNLQPQGASSSTPTVYQQSPADQRTMLQSYPGGMASMTMAQQSNTSDQVVEDPNYSSSQQEMGEAYEQYQTALKEVFTNIANGVLQSASDSLLNLSEWLLSKVQELGLTNDNTSLHEDRIKLWRDFNYAWLGLFQKQKDMMGADVAPQRNQSLISEDDTKKMGNELVRLCDQIERHGLVDYDYGVWEESILELIGECLDLFENVEDQAPNSAGRHASR